MTDNPTALGVTETLKPAERAAAGAAWLDKVRPGWATEIDQTALDMAEGCNCILGQLYGSYGNAVARVCPTGPGGMGDSYAFASDNGFNVTSWVMQPGEDPRARDARVAVEFAALEEAWMNEIGARRA